jgi:hypothetical protein
VAYRTYLQPDPRRPFTVAALVAMDLAYTRLHFLPGSQEPAPDPTRPGIELDEMQRLDDQRYLKASIRDFFYLTAAPLEKGRITADNADTRDHEEK